jgi:hypothetical protein
MWIHHIGEIAIGFFILLIILHFALHFIFKSQRVKKERQKQQEN